VTGRFLAAGAGLILLLSSAACRQKTESDLVLETVDRLARLAEDKDIETIMASIDDAYSDFEGRNKSGLRELVGGYFSGRMGIVVHRLGGRVELADPGSASLQADLAVSSGAAEALRRLVRLSPDIYRVRVDLVRPAGRWLIRQAQWTPVGPGEVFPESLGILKSLFPKSRAE
jgi:hypothetical protein